MLTIGEFSKLCKVSPKTLRYYDSINLLKPAYQNKENDYRYYTIDQLEKILLINRLKEYQFSLAEVQDILNSKDETNLAKFLRLKQDSIKMEIHRQKQLLIQMEDDINSLIKGKKLICFNENIEIKLVNTKPIRILSLRKKIKESDIGDFFNELLPLVEQQNLEVYGSPITIYHDKEYSESHLVDMEIGVPVSHGNSKSIRTLNGALCIYTKFTGSYNKLPEVLKTLYIWKEKENLEIVSEPYQKYIKGVGDTDNPEEYVTEIFLPVRAKNVTFGKQ